LDEIMELLSKIEESVNRINTIDNDLQEQLSLTDKEVNDISHYIEFENLDAYRGYKAYCELRDCLRKRREVKNKLEAIAIIKSNQISKGNIKKIKVEMPKLFNKKYTPRVRKDLFKD